ncbi:MAG: hypothetical protein J5554_08040 [Paludibacteraceae bacterium]|nr:hypothetical protein [Paludibacteraceae bacterium]
MKMLFLQICNDNPLIFVHWFSSSSTLRGFFIHGYDFPSLCGFLPSHPSHAVATPPQPYASAYGKRKRKMETYLFINQSQRKNFRKKMRKDLEGMRKGPTFAPAFEKEGHRRGGGRADSTKREIFEGLAIDEKERDRKA